MQTGTVTLGAITQAGGRANASVVFETAFPDTSYKVVVGATSDTWRGIFVQSGSKSTTGFTIISQCIYTDSSTPTVRWVAWSD